jgi:hypothetical protein
MYTIMTYERKFPYDKKYWWRREESATGWTVVDKLIRMQYYLDSIQV